MACMLPKERWAAFVAAECTFFGLEQLVGSGAGRLRFLFACSKADRTIARLSTDAHRSSQSMKFAGRHQFKNTRLGVIRF